MNYKNRFMRVNERDTTPEDWNLKKRYLAIFDSLKRKIEYESFLQDNKLRYQINQGEVYEIDFGRNVGSELNERHYAVVLHNSDPEAQNIVVVPLTSKIHYSYGEAIDLGYLPNINTDEKSYARVSQIRTVDKVRIYLKPIINSRTDGKYKEERQFGPVTRLTEEQFKLIVKGLNSLVNNRL